VTEKHAVPYAAARLRAGQEYLIINLFQIILQVLLKNCNIIPSHFGKEEIICYTMGNFKERHVEIPGHLQTYIPLIQAIGKTLGVGEVILYDLTQNPPVIIAKEGGITSRKPGTPSTQLLRDIIREMDDAGETMRVNYESATKSGKPLKSTTVLIYNENQELQGALSINVDMSAIHMLQHFIDQFSGKERVDEYDEMPQNTQEFLNVMIRKGIESLGKPVCYFDKKDNLEVVKFLNSNHIFSIKGSTDSLAAELNVSRYTIYNYLEEVKNS
jgi:predicted transcriptional regulator YheO